MFRQSLSANIGKMRNYGGRFSPAHDVHVMQEMKTEKGPVFSDKECARR